jgi:hypothetical protein
VQRANHFFSVPPKKHRSAKSSLILPTLVEYRCFQRGARMLRGETAEATGVSRMVNYSNFLSIQCEHEYVRRKALVQ